MGKIAVEKTVPQSEIDTKNNSVFFIDTLKASWTAECFLTTILPSGYEANHSTERRYKWRTTCRPALCQKSTHVNFARFLLGSHLGYLTAKRSWGHG